MNSTETLLALKIKELRLEANESQKDFLGKLVKLLPDHLTGRERKLPSQYISKIETGSTKYPKADGFFESLSSLSGIDAAKLKKMARTESSQELEANARRHTEPEEAEININGGHTVWGAPLELAFLEIREKDIHYSSSSTLHPSKGLEVNEIYSGATALEQLRGDRVDIAALSGNILDSAEDKEEYFRIMSIAKQVSCVFLCPKNSKILATLQDSMEKNASKAISTSEISDALIAESHSDNYSHLIAETGTVADIIAVNI